MKKTVLVLETVSIKKHCLLGLLYSIKLTVISKFWVIKYIMEIAIILPQPGSSKSKLDSLSDYNLSFINIFSSLFEIGKSMNKTLISKTLYCRF